MHPKNSKYMDLNDQLKENTRRFTGLLEEIPEERFTERASGEGTWSAAEIAEHMFRSEFGITRLFNGECVALSGRDSGSKNDTIRKKMQDMSKKVKAGGPILPTGKITAKNELIGKFSNNRKAIAEVFSEQDPTEECRLFQHPYFGYLTREEWLVFIMAHADRHGHQVRALGIIPETTD